MQELGIQGKGIAISSSDVMNISFSPNGDFFNINFLDNSGEIFYLNLDKESFEYMYHKMRRALYLRKANKLKKTKKEDKKYDQIE